MEKKRTENGNRAGGKQWHWASTGRSVGSGSFYTGAGRASRGLKALSRPVVQRAWLRDYVPLPGWSGVAQVPICMELGVCTVVQCGSVLAVLLWWRKSKKGYLYMKGWSNISWEKYLECKRFLDRQENCGDAGLSCFQTPCFILALSEHGYLLLLD